MTEKTKTYLKATLFTLVIVAMIGLSFGAGFWVSRITIQPELNDINYILDMYRKYYYDEKSDVVGIFADSLLDRYSDYYTKEEYDLIKKVDAGHREGVGITYSGTAIVSINGNSPAQRAGVKAGGTIKAFSYNGEISYVASDDEVTEAIDAIPAYVDFDMYIEYDGAETVYTVQKQDYKQTFVRYWDKTGKYGFMTVDNNISLTRLDDSDLTGDTAYVKIDAFNGTESGTNGCVGQFEKVMQVFKERGGKNIIIDLRGNGGGYLYIYYNTCRHFLGVMDGSHPVVNVIRDKYGNESKSSCDAVKYGEYGFENIIVLANIQTASASEAFIGALLDYDADNKVKVILEGYNYGGYTFYRTYGKGIMQTTYERLGGGAIKLTTAKLFWPVSGVCIHDVGITTELNSIFGDRIIEASEKGAYEDALALCK